MKDKKKAVGGAIPVVRVKDDSGMNEDGHDRVVGNVNFEIQFEGSHGRTC